MLHARRCALALALVLAACRKTPPVPADLPPVAVVQDFEHRLRIKRWPWFASGVAAVSKAWSVDGARSLEIDPGVMASFTDLRLHDWTGYAVLRFTVHNPGARTAALGFEIQDEHGELAERHQHRFGAPPGDHVIELDFSGGLWRGEENRPYRGRVKTPISIERITRLAFTNAGSSPLFVDRIELVKVPPLATPGGFTFDLGRRGQQVMGQTVGVFEDTIYTPERGYGFLAPVGQGARPLSYPTPLLGDGLPLGRGFRVDLPGGPYLGWIAFERGGFTENEQCSYAHVDLAVNGASVAGHDAGPGDPHFLFEDTEITDLAQIEAKIVRPAHAITRFRFLARAGENVFTLAVQGARGEPLRVAGLVLAPDTPEGAAFLDAHEERQRDAIALAYPPLDRARRKGRAEPARDLVAEPLALGAQLYPRDLPAHAEGAPAPEVAAITGQVGAVQLALHAARALDVHTEVAPLTSPSGATLSPPKIAYGRYLPTRPLGNGPVWIEINHYRPELDFHVDRDLARAVLLEWRIPADAPPGTYSGAIAFTAGDVALRVPVRLRVHAVDLPPIPIPVGLLMNALPFGPDVIDERTWWAFQQTLLDEQLRAGLNCVTGGPGLEFSSHLRDGQRVIEGQRALDYLASARARGPVLAAVGYGGFFHDLRLDDEEAKAFARAWKAFSAPLEVPLYIAAYDEPGTEDELSRALAVTRPLARAGLRTMGFLTRRRDDDLANQLIDATYAPAVNTHHPADLQSLAAQGKHPWVYNGGLDRWGMGLQLWRSLRAGAQGRLEWIGLITQGFAFDDLDGREPARSAWLVHDRFGPMPTPRWLAAREGLLDLRIRLALENAVPPGDPALAAWTMDGYGEDRAKWPDAALSAARAVMLDRLAILP